MRTTVELTDGQRASLLELAARRGEKGFSRIVQAAVDRYLAECSLHDDRARAAIAVLGTLDSAECDDLEQGLRVSRSNWR